MNIFRPIIFAILPLPALCFSASTPISLQEKLAIAKKMADDGVAGRAEAGRVVSGNFNFAEELSRYRGQANIEELHIDADYDLTESEESVEAVVVEPAPYSALVVAAEAEKAAKPTEIETPAAKPEQPDYAKVARATEQAEISTELEGRGAGAENTREHAELAQEKSEPEDTANAAAEGLAAETGQAASGETADSPYTPVDTSTDFVGGFFVGSLDDDYDDSLKIHEEVIEASKENTYLNYKNGLFYLVTDNYDALITGMAFTRACEDIFNEYFSDENEKLSFVRKITLQIAASDKFDYDGHFSVMESAGGDITLAVKWNETLDMSGFCRLLTGAALRKVAIEGRGSVAAAQSVPYWLEIALAALLEQKMRFGIPADLARISADIPPKSLESVLAFARNDGINADIKESQAFWTFIALDRAAARKIPMREFLRAALAYSDSPKKLAELVNARMKPADYDFDLWWRCLVTGEIWNRMGGIYTPEWSESELLRMAVIQADAPDGERVGVSVLEDLWYNRKNIANDVELRIVDIKMALARMNPLYYNTALSLGVMFETLLDGGRDEFMAAGQKFISDFNNSQILSARAKRMMASTLTENPSNADK